MREHIVAFDQGTTSSRTLLINRQGHVVDVAQRPIEQHFPHPGWVEHDPQEILATQLSTFTDVLVRNGLNPHDIDSIGITNQRETTVVWDRHTGEPVCNAIVWQCRRTTSIIDELCASPEVRERITAAGYEIGNVDVTVIAQRPKLAPHIPEMRRNLCRVLGLGEDQINVKATTEEHLGFTGSEEGMACHAVCLLK